MMAMGNVELDIPLVYCTSPPKWQIQPEEWLWQSLHPEILYLKKKITILLAKTEFGPLSVNFSD